MTRGWFQHGMLAPFTDASVLHHHASTSKASVTSSQQTSCLTSVDIFGLNLIANMAYI